MNLRALLASALGFLAVGGCGSPYLPPGLTQEEARERIATQGVAGRAAALSGACTPGMCMPCDVDLQTPAGELWAIPAQEPLLPVSYSSDCRLRYSDLPGFPAPEAPSAHRTRLQRDFSLELPAGRYALLFVDEDGCAECASLGWSSDTQSPGCLTVEVAPGTIVLQDLLRDSVAQ